MTVATDYRRKVDELLQEAVEEHDWYRRSALISRAAFYSSMADECEDAILDDASGVAPPN
jgi:hypothetical protein